MKRYCLLLALLAPAGCGQAPRDSDTAGREVASPAAEMADGPGINVTAAPGVAFDYRYSFRLSAQRIAAVQEQHAAACEKLGISRCRITGLRYTLVGDRSVEAMLAFKLDPALARGFGRQGIAAVTAAEGMLVDAEITGTDAGGTIRRLDRAGDDLAVRIADLDRRLAGRGLPAAERTELQRQRAQLAEQVRATRAQRADEEETLASTPVTFRYVSGAAIRSFGDDSPLTDMLNLGIGSARATAIAVGSAVMLLAPPLLLLALLWWLWRGLRPLLPRRRPRRAREEAPPPA